MMDGADPTQTRHPIGAARHDAGNGDHNGILRMGSTWFSAARGILVCSALSGALAGCGGVTVKDVAQLSAPRIAVLQTASLSADNKTAGTEIAIQVGRAMPLPLRGHISARIEAVWVVGNHRLALISGATADCPHQETLLIAQEETGQLRPLGKCEDRYAATLAGESWSARLITGRLTMPRDPTAWIFQNGSISGGAQPTLGTRRRPSQAERPSEAERGPDAEREPHLAAPETSASPQAAPAAPAPPPISRPVGDDVVPPPIGAGPLPGQSRPSPRLF